MLIVPENFDKVAGIIETAAMGDLCDRFICVGKLLAGYLDPVIIQIIHRCAVGKFFEITAKIAGSQVRTSGKGGKTQIFIVAFLNQGKDGF